jgi:hypothetical protein
MADTATADWPKRVFLLNETPPREVQVDQAEYLDLLRMGYINENGSKTRKEG